MKEETFGEQEGALPLRVLHEKYEIREVLGRGGFGVTYLCYDRILAQMVAVKEYLPRGKEGDGGLEGLQREAALIYGAFDLPGVCNVKDYFEENGRAYLVEEYLPGGTLKEFLEKKPGRRISFAECRSLFEPVLLGLCRLHAMGIVHRDVSPDNLMLDGTGSLKLIDFGAAEKLEESGRGAVSKGCYTPPEQYEEGGAMGPWSDIYALCCVMYEALTAVRPPKSYKRIKKDTLVPVSAYVLDVPAEAEQGILQGMSLDIQRRFFYGGNLMEKLGMETEGARALLESIRKVWGGLWLQAVTEKNTDVRAGKGRRLTRGQKKRILAGACLLGLTAGILTGSLWYYGKTHPEQVFAYRLSRARVSAQKNPGKNRILEGEPEYERLLEALAPYETKGTDDGKRVFDAPAHVLKKLSFENTGHYHSGKFYLDGETVRDIFAYVLDGRLEKADASYLASVGTEYASRYGKEQFYNNSSSGAVYRFQDLEGAKQNLEITTDPGDNRVKRITIGGSPDTLELVLKEVLPFVAPEVFLTEEEIRDFLASSRALYENRDAVKKGDETLEAKEEIRNHPKVRLKLHTGVWASGARSVLRIEPNGVVPY